MPIVFVSGNIFNSSADALVCPVNTVGVMGAGLARSFAAAFPGLKSAYMAAAHRHMLDDGQTWAYRTERSGRGVLVACVPTKQHWRTPSTLDGVRAAIVGLVGWLGRHPDVRTIAVPQLGCGLGGLDWRDVRPLIIQHMGALDVQVDVFHLARRYE